MFEGKQHKKKDELGPASAGRLAIFSSFPTLLMRILKASRN